MKNIRKRGAALLLTLALLLGLAAPAWAVSDWELDDAVTKAAAYIYETVKDPQVGSTGGEWAVIGLARSGCEVPDAYFQTYYANLEAYVRECGGVLHTRKYTEYSRVAVALSAIGLDARDVAGYDLLKPLGDFDKTIWQGINGPIWALIALDSGNYDVPVNPEAATQATRQMYIDEILSRRLDDGGWSLTGGTSDANRAGPSDPDITGMALQALAKYQDQPAVARAVQGALDCMSQKQNADGGFASWGTVNSESVVQMIVALDELGIPLDDPRFVKEGHTLLDNLLSYQTAEGGFQHTGSGSGNNLMASEQGLYGLVAAQRARQGKSSLYRMDDARAITPAAGQQAGAGLEGKHPDVKIPPVVRPEAAFADIPTEHPCREAAEVLAARGILSGRDGGLFAPDAPMTRAEFAAALVRALGLPIQKTGAFTDVAAGAWYAAYVDTAAAYGLTAGTGDGTFSPQRAITRQEAAVMLAHAAALCGMDAEMSDSAARNVLAQFTDYTAAAQWARPALALCCESGILDSSALELRPLETVARGEAARMLCDLLGAAGLL